MADVRAPAVSKTKEERARPLQPHLGRPTRERDEEGTALRPPRRPKAKEREGAGGSRPAWASRPPGLKRNKVKFIFLFFTFFCFQSHFQKEF
jgi:hypothetical protein